MLGATNQFVSTGREKKKTFNQVHPSKCLQNLTLTYKKSIIRNSMPWTTTRVIDTRAKHLFLFLSEFMVYMSIYFRLDSTQKSKSKSFYITIKTRVDMSDIQRRKAMICNTRLRTTKTN